MALSFPAGLTTHAGDRIVLIEDHEGSAGWLCHGCGLIATPPFVSTPHASAEAHAETCRPAGAR